MEPFKLIAECLALEPDLGRVARLARATSPDEVAGAAIHHGALPAVWRTLSRAEIDRPAWGAVQGRAQLMDILCRRFNRDLVQLDGALRRRGVAALWFKGPALAAQAWGDETARQFRDLDLLVPSHALGEAAAAAADCGYTSDARMPHLVSAARAGARTLPVEVGFGATPGRPWLEVHLRLFPAWLPIAMDADALAHAETVTVGGASVRTLDPTDHLLHACGNGLKDGWSRLASVADVARLASSDRIDWSRLRDQARGAERVVGSALRLAERWCGLQIAADARPMLDGAVTPPIDVGLAGIGPGLVGVQRDVQRLWLLLGSFDRAIDRLRVLAGVALDPGIPDFAAVKLPPRAFPLYKALRPLRIVGRYAR